MRLSLGLTLSACVMLVPPQLSHAQFTWNSCGSTSYQQRSPTLPKQPVWKLAGSYEAFATTAGKNSLAVDIDGDGRSEIVTAGVGGREWQVIGFSPSERSYEIVGSAPLPYPFGIHDQGNQSYELGRFAADGVRKLFSGGFSKVYDLASGRLELVSTLQGARAFTVDLDRDGQLEQVLDSGVVLDASLRRVLTTNQYFNGIAVGHFTSKEEPELLEARGRVHRWRGGQWSKVADLDLPPNFEYVWARGDLTADGQEEYVYTSDASQIQAHDFKSGKLLWQIVSQSENGNPNYQVADLLIADANDDGKLDVIAMANGAPGDAGEIRAYEGRSGSRLWSFKHADHYGNGLMVGNFDDDPGQELVFTTFRPVTGPSRIWVHDLRTRALEWMQRQELKPVRAMAMADLSVEPGDEVIVAPALVGAEGDTQLHVRSLDDMRRLSRIPSANLPSPSPNGVHAIAFGDVMGGVEPELVLGADDEWGVGSVYVYSWPSRTLLRSFKLDAGASVIDLVVASLDGRSPARIVAATTWRDTRAPGVRAYVLDAREGVISWASDYLFELYGSVGGLRVVDLYGNGNPKIIASGEHLAVIDGASFEIERISDLVISGFDIADVDRDGKLDIVGGTGIRNDGVSADHGRVVVFKGPDWAKTFDLKVCPGQINAIRWNSLEADRRQAYFSCGSQLGVVDFDASASQMVSPAIDAELGLQNHLFLVRGAGGGPRIIASGLWGAYSLAPAANLAPYLKPGNTCQPSAFVTHWRSTMRGGLNFLDDDGDELSLSIIQSPNVGAMTLIPSNGSVAIDYTVGPYKGMDIFATQLSDGIDTSPIALSTILVANVAPEMNNSTFEVTAGSRFAGWLTAYDSDSDPLEFEVLELPVRGTLNLGPSGSFTYQAPSDLAGQVTFVVRAFDRVDRSNPATITLVATPPASGGGGSGPGNGGNGASSNSSGGGGGVFGAPESLLLLALLWLSCRCLPRQCSRPYSTF